MLEKIPKNIIKNISLFLLTFLIIDYSPLILSKDQPDSENYLNLHASRQVTYYFIIQILNTIGLDLFFFQKFLLSLSITCLLLIIKRKVNIYLSLLAFVLIVSNFYYTSFSKIILTERNSRDICLSIFKINFKNGFMNFAYNHNEIAEFYNNYLDLINFWKNIFKEEIYNVSYEALIRNPDDEIKSLINFCDLPWDVNCLNHHKNKSSIYTASIDQARKPIYQTSENKSNYYSDHLNKMYSLLKN